MKTRTAIIGSVVWTVLVCGLAFFLLWRAWEAASPRERRGFEARAERMGGAAGTFAAIGCGIIWVTWAVQRKRANDRKSAD